MLWIFLEGVGIDASLRPGTEVDREGQSGRERAVESINSDLPELDLGADWQDRREGDLIYLLGTSHEGEQTAQGERERDVRAPAEDPQLRDRLEPDERAQEATPWAAG